MVRLFILKTGVTAPEVIRSHGDYDRWFTDALSGLDVSCTVHDVTAGPVPATDAFTGVIVTGSAKAVYEREPWMNWLAGFLDGRGPAVPVLCVCFGMQFLAQARGGRVTLNPSGWEIGGTQVRMTEEGATDPLFEGLPRTFRVLTTHEDSVEELPPGAVLLASNHHTPFQAFRCGDRAWGVQFHPEASVSLIEQLIKLRRDDLRKDAEKRGLPGNRHVEGLLETIRHPDILQGARVLRNFVSICDR